MKSWELENGQRTVNLISLWLRYPLISGEFGSDDALTPRKWVGGGGGDMLLACTCVTSRATPCDQKKKEQWERIACLQCSVSSIIAKIKETKWGRHWIPYPVLSKSQWAIAAQRLICHSIQTTTAWHARIVHLRSDMMQHTRTPFLTIPVSNSTWTFRCIGREGR